MVVNNYMDASHKVNMVFATELSIDNNRRVPLFCLCRRDIITLLDKQLLTW